jgi:glutaredoxin 3
MKVKIYSKDWCPFCSMAKTLLKSKLIDFEEIFVDKNDFDFNGLAEKTKMMTVPQIFFGDKFIGGFSELREVSKEEFEKVVKSQK